MNDNDSAKPLQRMVDRVCMDPFFLGWALTAYKADHGMDNQQLAGWLECNAEALSRLALCRMPDDKRDEFQQNVQHISAFVPCNTDRLVRLLREVAVFSALRKEHQIGSSNLLLAARDRKGDDIPQKTSENEY